MCKNLWQKILLVIFGIFLSLVLLEIGLRLAGFILASLQERLNLLAIRREGAYRIMCLGESTTAGGWGRGNYPEQLEDILNQLDLGMKFSVVNKGLPGMTTFEIVEQLEANLDKYKPQLVITMMGINDFGNHIPYEKSYLTRKKTFLERFKVFKLFKYVLLHTKSKFRKKPISREMNLKNKLQCDPKSRQLNLELARLYEMQGRYGKAKQQLIKFLGIKPEDGDAYFHLGDIYLSQSKLDKAEESFLKAIELGSSTTWVHKSLGVVYERQKKLKEAEIQYEKSIELDPQNIYTILGLAWLYKKQGKYAQAEELLRKAAVTGYKEQEKYAALSVLYRETGNLKLSQKYKRKSDQLIIKEFYQPETQANYLQLKRILDKRGVKYLCMQYPTRSIEPLRMIFNSESNIIYVDNESIFKDALKKDDYGKYFSDMFGGDFGHCTIEGNRLIAKNAAKVLLKQVFKK